MASEKIVAIVDEVAALSVLELAELVKEVEERFGVSAAAAVAVAAPAAGAAATALVFVSKPNYLRATFAPASSSFALRDSASSLPTASLRVLGAPSTAALASASPRPVISRTTLITLIFDAASKDSRTTSNSVFSSTAAAGKSAARAKISIAKTIRVLLP